MKTPYFFLHLQGRIWNGSVDSNFDNFLDDEYAKILARVPI